MDNTAILDEILNLAKELLKDKEQAKKFNVYDIHPKLKGICFNKPLTVMEHDGIRLAELIVSLDKEIVEGRWLPKRWQQQLPPGWKLVGPLDHPDCPFSLESDENPK